jgi:hypothetical protein
MINSDELYLTVIIQYAQSIALLGGLAKNAHNERDKTVLMERLTRMIYRMAEYTQAHRLGIPFRNNDDFI